VEQPSRAELEALAERTRTDWLRVFGNASSAAAWITGFGLDWSLDVGLEAKDLAQILLTRVSAYLRTQPNGKAP
jgi:hypothetical protein